MVDARRSPRPHNPLNRLEFGLVVVVVGVAAAVAVPEYLDLRQEAKEDSAKSRLTQAKSSLQHRQAVAGTYAGATVPAGVRLRSAGRRSYCVETMADGRSWHESGLDARPARGAC